MVRQEIRFEAVFNENNKEGLKEFIAVQSSKQSKERLLTNKLLAIQYTLEDYIRSEEK